jgi:RNA polymerase sigma factor (sigma-70 family)
MTVNRLQLLGSRSWLDERAFEAIFTEHYPRIYAVLFRLVGDRLEADDLAAEAFWKLWEKPPSQEENVAGWLYRVATRLGYNALRAARRRAWYETMRDAAPLNRSSRQTRPERQSSTVSARKCGRC